MIDKNELMDNEVINYAVVGFLTSTDYDKKTEKITNFYNKFRENVNSKFAKMQFPPLIANIIMTAPDLFYLVWKLTFEPDIEGEHKRKIAYALLYFMSPVDILPDIIPGVGIVDDVLVVCYALNSILNEIDHKYIDMYWNGDEKLIVFVQSVLREIDNVREFIMEYIKNPFINFRKTE